MFSWTSCHSFFQIKLLTNLNFSEFCLFFQHFVAVHCISARATTFLNASIIGRATSHNIHSFLLQYSANVVFPHRHFQLWINCGTFNWPINDFLLHFNFDCFDFKFTHELPRTSTNQIAFLLNNSSAAINFLNWSPHMFQLILRTPSRHRIIFHFVIVRCFVEISKHFLGFSLFDSLEIPSNIGSEPLRVMTEKEEKPFCSTSLKCLFYDFRVHRFAF
jgi:hypothetical protein